MFFEKTIHFIHNCAIQLKELIIMLLHFIYKKVYFLLYYMKPDDMFPYLVVLIINFT